MRNAAFLLGILVVTACSIDHITVAALDDAGTPSAGMADSLAGSAGSAGSAGTSGSAGNGGVFAAAGAEPEGEAGRVSIAAGGSTQDGVLLSQAGEGGTTSELRCSCLGQPKPQFCGSDGVTYPIECSDGGTCLPPSVDCWHACPCLAGDTGAGATTSWFSLDCVPSTQCAEGVVCMTFTNVSPEARICTSTFN